MCQKTYGPRKFLRRLNRYHVMATSFRNSRRRQIQPSIPTLSTMKFFVAAVAAALAINSASAATCATSTLSALLSDQYIDQCGSDSGYAFTSGVKPTDAEAKAMCASSACHSLLADAQAMNLQECTIPLGNKISLLADLINYVPTFCTTTAPSPSTSTAPTPSSSTSTAPTPSSSTTSAPTKPAAC